MKPLPFNAGGLLGGTAKPEFPAGEPGGIVVVTPDAQVNERGTLIIAFRNNTGEAVSKLQWQGSAKDGDKVVAKGMSMSTTPGVVEPGEVGLAAIGFSDWKAIPENADYSLSVASEKPDTSAMNTAPLKVTQAKLVNREVVGTVVNETGKEVAGPINVNVYCFNGNEIVSVWPGYLEEDQVAKGGKVDFTQGVYNADCPTFVVGVNGSFK